MQNNALFESRSKYIKRARSYYYGAPFLIGITVLSIVVAYILVTISYKNVNHSTRIQHQVSSISNTELCIDPHFLYHESIHDGINAHVDDDKVRKLSGQIQPIRSQKHFIVILLHNSQHLFDHWNTEFIRFIELIGDISFSNIFVSIHESGSTDNTPVLLTGLKDRLQQMGIKIDIETSLEPDPYQQSDSYTQSDRIEKLSYLRNRALRRLISSDIVYDNVVYVNDVFFCATDLLTLVVSSTSNDADVTCSVDMFTKVVNKAQVPSFYDIWVARDLNGQRFENFDPFIRIESDMDSWNRGKAFQVFSCWNGAVVIKADIFQHENIRFRAGRRPFECTASECELLAKDLWVLGRYKIIIEPKVVVTYNMDHFIKLSKYVRASRLNWVNDTVQTIEHRIHYQNTPPIYTECCALRPKRKYIIWNECFMEHRWALAYELLGKPWDSTTPPPTPSRVINTVNDAFTEFRNRVKCDIQSGNNSVDNNQIPPIIHQIGRTSLISDVSFFQLRCMMSWWDQNRCHEYRYIGSDQEAMAIIKGDAPSQDLTSADFNNGGEIADYARYVLMHKYGGVYADLDTYAIAPLDLVIKDHNITHVVGYEAYFKSQDLAEKMIYARRISLSLHLFAAAPKSILFRQLIDKVRHNLHSVKEIYDRIYEKRLGLPNHLETIFKTGPGPFSDALLYSPAVRKVPLNTFTGEDPFRGHPSGQDFTKMMAKSVLIEDSPTVAIHYNFGSWFNTCSRSKYQRVDTFDHFLYRKALFRGQWIASFDKSIPDHVHPLWISPPYEKNTLKYGANKDPTHFYLLVNENGFGIYAGRGPDDDDVYQLYNVTVAAEPAIAPLASPLIYLGLNKGYLELSTIDKADCVLVDSKESDYKKFSIYQQWNSTESVEIKEKGDKFMAILRNDGRLAIYAGSSPKELLRKKEPNSSTKKAGKDKIK